MKIDYIKIENMGLTAYRFTEFWKLDKLFPAGIDTDLESMKVALRTIQKGAGDVLKIEIDKMEGEMKNDIVIENEVIYSNVDYLDFFSSSSALNIIYNSMVISIFSFIETRLMLLCKLIEKRNKILLSDISGKGIYKYKRYLSKVHDIDFNPKNEEWELLGSYAFLRNKLIHSHSVEINMRYNEKDYKKLKKIKSLSVTESSDIATFHIRDQECVNDFFALASSFIQFICYIKR